MSRQRIYSMVWYYLRGLAAGCACWLLVLYLSGCTQNEPAATVAQHGATNQADAARPKSVTPIPDVKQQSGKSADADVQRILSTMSAPYRQAKTYADAGQMVQNSSQNGKALPPQTFDFSLAFQRPNKVQMRTCGVELACDGASMRAIVPGIEGQVLTRAAPEKLRKEDFLDPAFADPELARALDSVAGPIQLELLLDDRWLTSLLKEATATSLLEVKNIDGQSCERVKLTTPTGAVVLWIDDAKHLLRRVEFLSNAGADANGFRMDSAVAEFRGARINEPIADKAFAFELPADSVEVKRLVALDRPMPPPDLFGKAIGDFSFATIDGGKISRQTVVGKPTVLLFWSMESLPCMDVLTALDRISKQSKFAGKASFFAINTDAHSVPNRDLATALARLNVSLPIARNEGTHSEETFKVQYAPTLIVLGADGVVQDSEVGKNPELEIQLPATLEKLLSGENTFADAKSRSESRIANYRRAIQDAQREANSVVREIPHADILPASEPTKLKLTKLWTASDIKSPGNILIVQNVSGPPELLIHDRWQAVSQVDLQGAVIARHNLNLPPQTPVASLRTAVDKQGQRFFAAFASPQQQVYLYDANWKFLTAIPDVSEGKHDGISDVQFVNAQQAGELELAIGFWGSDMGVHRFTLQGKRVWRNRNIAPVLGIAQAPRQPDGHADLLFTTSRGVLLAYNAEGNPNPKHDLPVAAHPLLRVFTADHIGKPGSFCCLVQDGEGNIGGAIGGQVGAVQRWGYPLPKGVYTEPVEIVTSAALFAKDDLQWILAGPDGTVHILSAEGTPIDHFATGAAITGIAASRFGHTSVLLISSANGLQAWQVDPGQLAARPNNSH